MKKSAVLFFILFGTLNILAQSDTGAPKPEVVPPPEFNDTSQEDFQKRMGDMDKSVRQMRSRSMRREAEILKEEKKRVDELVAPHPDDLTTYKAFLKQSKTGIFRLMPDYGCETKNMLRVDGVCANHIPGKWAYSLRQRDYSNDVFHDIWFADGNLTSIGLLSQGIFTSLGDVPLQNVFLSGNGMKYLFEFAPATDRNIIKKQYQMISKGFENDGFFYSNKINVAENTTYVLRIVAYRMADKHVSRFSPKNLDKLTADDEKFFFIRYDKRNDSIFAFRVIRKSDDGGITILWKELFRQRSPEIVFGKKEKLRDFRN